MEGTKSKKRPAQNSAIGRNAKKQKSEEKSKTIKKKDKNAVKRACSSYIFFSKDFRQQLIEKNKKTGDAIPKVNEIAKLCGEKWRVLSDKDKKPYEELAAEDKKRYLEQTGKNIPKDSGKPKRPPTAYFLFLAHFRKKMAGIKLPDGQKVPSLAGEKWRTMSDKDKEQYLKDESKEKAKYEEAMKEYRKKVKEEPKPAKPKKKVEPEENDEDEIDEDEEDEEEEEEEEEDDDDDDDDDDE